MVDTVTGAGSGVAVSCVGESGVGVAVDVGVSVGVGDIVRSGVGVRVAVGVGDSVAGEAIVISLVRVLQSVSTLMV